jgi:integrase
MSFSRSRYRREDTLPFVPLQKELDTLMDASSRNLREATLLRLLYETGVRIGEATRLQFKDFDFEKKSVRVLPEKGSSARELKLSDRLRAMLKDVFHQYPDKPFPTFSGAVIAEVEAAIVECWTQIAASVEPPAFVHGRWTGLESLELRNATLCSGQVRSAWRSVASSEEIADLSSIGVTQVKPDHIVAG